MTSSATALATAKSVRSDGYLPLRAYAVLGDMRSVALVGADGAVDWLAMPAIDDPPVCAALLDPAAGGSIELAPTGPFEVQRRYVDDTMVLETTFITATGTVRVTDALNLGAAGELPWAELARRVDVDAGEVPMRWSVRPGHGLIGIRPWCHVDGGQARMLAGDHQLAVITDGLGPTTAEPASLSGTFTAGGDQPALLAIVATRGEPVHIPTSAEIRARLDATAGTWRRWSDKITYHGPHRDDVVRSALTLKALTVAGSGAIAGAATTSLPEKIGGERNFDYRFAWIRDSSFAIDAMGRLGLSEEVHAGLAWLLRAVSRTTPDLRVFYALDGAAAPADMASVDAPGYQGSAPVHTGNAAADQMQLGCFGDLLDAVWRYARNGGRLDPATAGMVGDLADRVCDMWRRPDAGIWELGTNEAYTISKIGCWVALDRTLRLAAAGQLTSLHEGRWSAERDAIRSWTDTHCWSAAKQSYTFYAGTDDLDAAVLLAARTGYCDGDDPRLHSTIDAVASELGVANSPLLYRYSGQQDKEGTFTACACWMVEALTHAGRLDEAAERLEGIVGQANDVGLYTEEIDPLTGAMLGNIPQTLSHLAIIGAATAVAGDRQSNARSGSVLSRTRTMVTGAWSQNDAMVPSGDQYEICHGDQRATVVEVGGGIRTYTVGERPVLDAYPLDAMCDGAHGAPLLPWPNRLGDGRYRFGDTDYQVALSEPDKQNAIHGFMRWRTWQAVSHETHRVVMGSRLYPLKGFPFSLDLRVAYELGDAGLSVTTTATNRGTSQCPYGAGQHPYLSPGSELIDDCTLTLDATTRITTDPQRQLPTGTEEVDGTAYDFRNGKRLGDQKIDDAFTDLARDHAGRAWARLAAPDGRTVELWVDEHYPIIEIYTGDTLSADRQRRGMGTEPMTMPPNGFQTGDHLVSLAPNESLTTAWGVRLVER